VKIGSHNSGPIDASTPGHDTLKWLYPSVSGLQRPDMFLGLMAQKDHSLPLHLGVKIGGTNFEAHKSLIDTNSGHVWRDVKNVATNATIDVAEEWEIKKHMKPWFKSKNNYNLYPLVN